MARSPWGIKLSINSSIISANPVNPTISGIDLNGSGNTSYPLAFAVPGLSYGCFNAGCDESQLSSAVATFNSTLAGTKAMIYKIENQDAAIAHIGHEVSITGTLTEEVTIGVTYETQGNLHIDSIGMLNPAAVSAQEASQFQTWMKSLTPLMNSTRKGITANDKAAVSTSANQIATTFEQIVSFWQKQHDDDALKFAVTARDEAKATALASTTFDQRMAMQKLQAACSGCHLAHRAGKAGKFTIEQ